MVQEMLRDSKKERYMGPHGLGDPEDTRLRKVELVVLIPKIMRDKAKAEKCIPEVADFHKCALENGLGIILKCRQENSKMKECLTNWFRNSDFQKECQDVYLKERSEYRRTGITRKQRAAANEAGA